MAGDELFKRYLEIGASILGMSRERAENIVKDLVASGEVARGQATKAADWLVERGRAGSEELAEMVRREVRQQVTALGLATSDDIARLEAELAEVKAAAAEAGAAAAAAAAAGPTAAPGPTSSSPAAPPAPKAKPAGARKVPSAAGRRVEEGGAGINRSGSVRRRSSSASDATPPAGGPGSPEG
jgi:polyhydroxyalkanoate synthesis regulator phasin